MKVSKPTLIKRLNLPSSLIPEITDILRPQGIGLLPDHIHTGSVRNAVIKRDNLTPRSKS